MVLYHTLKLVYFQRPVTQPAERTGGCQRSTSKTRPPLRHRDTPVLKTPSKPPLLAAPPIPTMSVLGGIVTWTGKESGSSSKRSKFPFSTLSKVSILNNFQTLGVYALLSAYCSAFVVAKYSPPRGDKVAGSYRAVHALLHPLRMLLKPLLKPLLTPLLKGKQDSETGGYLRALLVSARSPSPSESATAWFEPSLLGLLYDVPPPPPPPAASEVAKKAASDAAAGAVNVVRRKVRPRDEERKAGEVRGANTLGRGAKRRHGNLPLRGSLRSLLSLSRR